MIRCKGVEDKGMDEVQHRAVVMGSKVVAMVDISAAVEYKETVVEDMGDMGVEGKGH